MRGFLAMMALLVLTGCGGGDEPATSDEPTRTLASSSSPEADAGNAAKTDGQLGEATFTRPGERPEIKPGGKPDTEPKPRGNGNSGVSGSGACDGAEMQPSAENLSPISGATLCLVNAERSAAGLGALRSNDKLAQAAQAHGASMVEQQYFSHTGKDGSDPAERAKRTGYTKGTWLVGENLAWGSGTLAQPRSIVVSWMNSQGHRENILRSQFEEIGIAVLPGNPQSKDGAGGTYVTVFGKASGGDDDGGGGSGGGTTGGSSGSTTGGELEEEDTQPTPQPRPAKRKCNKLRGKKRARCRAAARR